MMDFGSENQGQPHLNPRFGTIPGRNWAHSHHDRHQAAHYPVYYGEQQDQSRESSYWAVPGSRTGGAQREYTHWTDPEITSSSSSYFPFKLDRHAQSHQDLGEYQQHEARSKDWATSHRAAKDYERGFLREGYQRRWEPSSPVCYNRDFSAKRSDSSYRELEAWAARYSHSLPRRRRIEAELRGASQGLVERSRTLVRDGRSGIDLQVTAQHAQQNPESRVSGLWDRCCRQQAPAYYPSRAPAPDTSHILDMKENTEYQRRIFSQPPGYIAPPPYNSPHKCSPIMQHCSITQEQGGKRSVPWLQPIPTQQEGNERKEENDESKTSPEVEGLKHRRRESGAVQTTQNTHMQSECVLAVQHPQAVQNQKTTSKIIEGRKFRLNKKTGGMTIFCLVSRIAGATETPSLPQCTSQTHIQSTERGEVSTHLSETSQMHELADEVDFISPTLPEQSCASDTLTSTGKEMPDDYGPNKAEDCSVFVEKTNVSGVDSTSGRQAGQSVQPVPVKYPLWREPGSSSRAETQGSPTSCIAANTGEKDVFLDSPPTDTEMRTQDIEEDTQDLIIDTASVVKTELIPSPKTEHVHYLGSIVNPETSPFGNQIVISSELNNQLNQDITNDQNSEQMNKDCEADLDSKLLEKEEKSYVSSPCMQPSLLSERETMKERAERVLGISQHGHIAKQKAKESFLSAEEPDEEVKLPTSKQTGTAEEGGSRDRLRDTDDIRNLVTNEHGESFAVFPEGALGKSKEEDSSSTPETDHASPESEVTLPSLHETCKHETQLDESSTPPDLCHSSSLSPPELNFPWNMLALSTGGLEPEQTVNLPAHPGTSGFSTDLLPSLFPSGSSDSSSASTPSDHLTSPLLDLTFQPDNESAAEDRTQGKTCLPQTEINCELVATDITQDVASQQKAESHQAVVAACAINKQPTKDAGEEEGRLEPSKDTVTDVALTPKLECVQTKCDFYLKKSSLMEEHSPVETNVAPTDSMGHTSGMDEANESSAFDQNELINPQNQIETEIFQDPNQQTESPPLLSSLDGDELSELPSPPHALLESETKLCPLFNVNWVCPVAPSIAETVPPLSPDSCEEATCFPFGSLTEPSSVLPPSSAPPPHEENVFPGFLSPAAHKEEPEYPKSLWDVVNRIRKHTAPDSENEEEDMCEVWDPGDNLSCPDVAVDMNSDQLLCDETENGDVLEDSAEMRLTQQDQEEPKEHADEDAISCSSTSSHGSEDTVIVAHEDGSEETCLCATTEKRGSAEVKDETVAEEDDDASQSGQSDGCPVEAERIQQPGEIDGIPPSLPRMIPNVTTAQPDEDL